MADKPIGTMFVELDLDASRYTRGQQKLLKDAQSTTLNIEQNFKNLGIKSSAEMDLMRAKITNSYNMIANSSKATANDILRAEKAKNEQLASLNAKQFGEQTNIIETLKKNWIAAAAVVFSAAATIGKAMDMADAGSKLEKQEAAFANLAKTAGTSSSHILDSLKRVSQGMVADARLIEASGKALLMGLPAADITKYMEIAAATSKATGQTVTEAFNDITLGVARQSKMILDNLGIIISVEKSNEDYARSLGKTAEALTDAEKRQAFANATLKTGEEMIRRIGSSQSTLDGAAKATAEWSNAMDSLSKMIAEKSNPLFEAVAVVLRRINIELRAGQDSAREYGSSFESVNSRIAELNARHGDMENRKSWGYNEPADIEYRRLVALREKYRTAGTTDFGRGNVYGRYGSLEPNYYGSMRVSDNEIAYDVEKRWDAFIDKAKQGKKAQDDIWKDYKQRYPGSQQSEAMLADQKAYEDWRKMWAGYEQRLPESQQSEAMLADQKRFEEWKKSGEESMNYMAELSQRTAERMQDNFSNLFFDAFRGELKSLEDYANAVFESLQRAMADMAGQMATQAIFGSKSVGGTDGGGGLIGWLGGLLGSAAASQMHSGGTVDGSGPHRSIPAWMIATAPRLHSGLAPDEFPAVLQRGERVIPRDQANLPAAHITINVSAPQGRMDRESLSQTGYAAYMGLRRAWGKNA